jgi:response regulator of citrate/malate metabolism
MRYYDTWRGEFSNDKEIELSNGQLILLDIYLESGEDMAVWVRPNR